MTRIIATGDWHLDRATAGYDRYEDVRLAILDTVDAAVFEKAALYVFLGDLSNPNNVRSHRAAATAVEIAMRLRDNGIDSLWIQGNHDVIDDGNVDASGNCCSTLSPVASAGFTVASIPQMVMKAGIKILALPYPASHDMYDPAEAVSRNASDLVDSKQKTLVVGHLSMVGAQMGSESVELARGRQIEWPVDAISKFAPGAITIAGHYHRAQTCNGVAFAGSLARLGFDEESNSPSFLVVEL